MATAKGSIKLNGRFPAGTKVGLVPRVSDSYSGGPVHTSSKVSKESTVEFSGLEPFSQWWAVAKVDGVTRAVAVTAKPSRVAHPDLAASRHATQEQLRQSQAAAAAQAEKAREKDPLAGSPALGGPDSSRQVVRGARGSGSARVRLEDPAGVAEPQEFAGEAAGQPTEGAADPRHPRQEDASEVPQRSNTLTGEATPIEAAAPAADDAAAKKRSEASKKAAATRKRNKAAKGKAAAGKRTKARSSSRKGR